MIVSVISPKGGAGKSTLCLVLASVFSSNPQTSVAIVDADPRQSLARIWLEQRKETGDKLPNAPFTIISDADEDSITETIEAARQAHDITFVDVEGTANMLASYVAMAADLCLVPMRASKLDADGAGAAMRMIANTAKAARRAIPLRVVITNTDAAIVTTSYKEILAELDGNKIPRFQTELMRRAPFERAMAEGRTLFELPQTASTRAAISNANKIGLELSETMEQADEQVA